jgi:hypothetical protein
LSSGLLAAYAVGGGIPPASYEVVRVYEDGLARAVVGNAWPFGHPQDEAGTYAHRFDDAEMDELEREIAKVTVAPEESGPGAADAGRFELRLGDGRAFAWPTTSAPPSGVATLAERMRSLLGATRRHPVGVLILRLQPPAEASVEEPFSLGLALRNSGREAVKLSAPGLFRAQTSLIEGDVSDGPPDLETLAAATPLSAEAPAELAPGEERVVDCETVIASPGTWRLDAVAQIDAEVPYEGDPIPLACTMLKGPAVVRIA